MPRKSRKKQPESPAGEPVAAVLETLKEEIPALKSASELPRQLPDPRLDVEPPPQELITPALDTARPRQSHDKNGTETSFAAKIAAERPKFAPVPNDYKNVVRHETAGIRVNKGIGDHNRGTAALQFAENRPLSRTNEYNLMERVQEAGFQYKPETRQWQRPKPEGMALGENVIDATRIAAEVARSQRRGR